MKQLRFSILFLLTFVFCTNVSAFDFEVDGIYYGFDATTQSAYVTSGENKYSGKIIIPQSVTYNGKTLNVTAIGEMAFFECADLVSVDIPQSIMTIGPKAFKYCWALTTINIPENITEIKDETFRYCGCLTSIKFPDQLTSIGYNAFERCEKLESVSIPNSVVEIKGEAFMGCVGLKKISIPGGVNKLYSNAFRDCSGLKTIVLENSENEIICESGIFYNHYDAFWGTSPQNIYIGRSIPQGLFYGQGGGYEGLDYNKITTISIGEDVKYASIINLSSWPSLVTIYCFSNNPESMEIPFGTKAYANAKLYVPIGTKDKYLNAEGWKNFFQIEEMNIDKMWNGVGEPGDNDNPVNDKCERPTISYSNGKLSFNSATEGAICMSSITDSDVQSYNTNEVQLNVTYNISVYATKAGYENSETSTATLCWIDVDPKTEGVTNGVASIRSQAVLIQAEDGLISVDGADDGTIINVYGVNGVKVGSAISRSGNATVSTSLPSGGIAVVKIGEKSMKVSIK